MDRVSAYLLLRRFLKRPASRNLALAVESIMEELASAVGQGEPETWSVMGLLSQLDLEYAEHNPEGRGVAAREQAELEGLDPMLARSLERWPEPGGAAGAGGSLRPLVEDALAVAVALAGAALEGAGSSLPPDVERRMRRAEGERFMEGLERLGLGRDGAARLGARVLSRLEQDLR